MLFIYIAKLYFRQYLLLHTYYIILTKIYYYVSLTKKWTFTHSLHLQRRVQDEPNASTNDRTNSSSTYNSNVFPGPSLSTTKPSNVNPLNLPTTSHGESSASRFRLESPFTAPQAMSEFRTIHQSVSLSDTVHDRICLKTKRNPFSFPAAHQPLPSSSRSDLLNTSSTKRPHLNDSIAPSSSLLWVK